MGINEIANKTQTDYIYSNDKKLHSEMTSNSIKDSKLFKFADKDGNGKLDKNEITRYNGPIMVKNYDTTETRYYISGKPTDAKPLDEKITKFNEIELYPSLKIEDVNSTKGKALYKKIDSDGNGVLSTKEMESAMEIENYFLKAEKEINELRNSSKKEKITKAFKHIADGTTAIPFVLNINPLAGGALIIGGVTTSIVLDNKCEAMEETRYEKRQHLRNEHKRILSRHEYGKELGGYL